ncbi:hypothetical protein [Clostridium sp. JNZ J1-5]
MNDFLSKIRTLLWVLLIILLGCFALWLVFFIPAFFSKFLSDTISFAIFGLALFFIFYYFMFRRKKVNTTSKDIIKKELLKEEIFNNLKNKR